MKITRKNRLYRQLVATALIMGGALQLAAPVLAAGTAAGQGISNTATGTYEDQNNPGVPINSTSNTVTITVAEVSGITVTASGVSNQAGGSAAVTAGSQLYYTYTITNVGNAPTQFRIPNLATVTGPGTVSGAVQTSTGGAAFAPISGSELITGSIPVGGTVQVRVPITVNATATSGQTISVQLGQTPSGNDQNVARVADGGDVYTVPPTPDTFGPPVNGVREASATQAASIGASITPQAFATILLTHGAFNNPVPTDITQGFLPYSLNLRVESTAPAGSTLTPSDLLPTSINLNGTATNEVLISDVIPAGTKLSAIAPTAPAGWTVVYTDAATDTLTKVPNDPTLQWTTTKPTNVARIGFINSGTIAKGTTVTGFTFSVSPTANVTTNINDIAQVLGQTTAGAITASNPLVYDESGDQNPSNYNDNGTPGSNTPTTGVAIPANDGSDVNNNNTAAGAGGEDNIFSISGPSAAGTGVLNGPNGAPAATGPSGANNDDFTNKSVVIPASTTPAVDASGNPVALTFQPAAISFTNTAQNTGTATADISLVPATPAAATDLPANTTATISQGANSATYTYNGTVWTFTSGVGTANGVAISATNPLRLAAVPANGTVNYGVGVQLPSTGVLNLTGYPVTITGFVDNGATGGTANNGIPDGTEPQNATIDRLYTGFLKLYKESRIIQGTGPALATAADASYSTTPKKPAPGNIIQYRVTYTNISTGGGTGDVLLNATKVVITEDGTTGSNNWAKDNDNNGVIDTSNMVGKTTDSNSGAITFFSGNPATTPAVDETGTTASTDVSKYIDTLPGAVAPGTNGTFTFQRLVN